MSCGRSCSKRRANAGFGWLCVGLRARLWLTLSGSAAKPLAKSCGSASRKLIVVDIAIVTSGKRIKESSPPISTRRSAKTERRDGTRREVEQHLAAAARTLCTQELIVFEVGGDARG